MLRILALLPLNGLRKLGEFYGRVVSSTRSRIVHTTQTNIRLCFPDLTEHEQEQLVRRSLSHMGCTIFEMAAIWYWKAEALEELVVAFDGVELLAEQLTKGGVLCVCPHWGNWEFTAYAIGSRFSSTSLYDSRRLKAHDQRITRARSRFGLAMASVERDGLRKVLTALRSNQLVIVLPDQVPTRGNSVLVEFMGNQAVTTTMVGSLANKTNATPVLLTYERVPEGFHIRAEPLPHSVTASDPAESAQSVNNAIAEALQRDPAQYQWEYKRFRRVPGVDVYA